MSIDKTQPARGIVSITAHNTNTFDPTRGVYIGFTGSFRFTTSVGEDITIANAAQGYHPLKIIAVHTDSSCTDIHALY